MSYGHLSFQKNIMYFIYLVISIYLYITEILLKFVRYKKTHLSKPGCVLLKSYIYLETVTTCSFEAMFTHIHNRPSWIVQ